LGDHIEKNELGRACSKYGGENRCIQGLGGEPEGKRPHGRPRHRWEDNIKTDLQKVGWGGGAEAGLICFRIGKACKGGKEPSSSIKWGEFLD
jgi:hypothetical protein